MLFRHSRFQLCTLKKNSSTTRNPFFQNLVNLANNSNNKGTTGDENLPVITRNDELVELSREDKLNSNTSSSSALNSTRSPSLSDLSWPLKLRLTGHVYIPDSTLYQQNHQKEVYTPTHGDIRVRRHYYARDASSEHSDAVVNAIQTKGRHNFQQLRNGNSNNSKNSSSSSASSSISQSILQDSNYFADSGERQGSFRIQSSKQIFQGRQNMFFAEASPFFSSMDEFGTKYHQLDGHELVEMQRTGKFRLSEAPSGSFLIDVWVKPDYYTGSASLIKNRNDNDNNNNMTENSSNRELLLPQHFGYWVPFYRVTECLGGMKELSFKSVEQGLSNQQRIAEFLQTCQGVPAFFVMSRSSKKKVRNPTLNTIESPAYEFKFEGMEKNERGEKVVRMDPSWWPRRYRK